ncbi:virulence protein RhuM/Fic/DOC family protein [Bacteroides sp.]|uniref:virulence protein RhuM/Fic/DOC family protein n=1 Tax=Bacteroides sp. TaxID=29523 RepID=UPI0025C6CF84|nr:virulence protein RhuM/Fic/DOC family protein [Bacteroides sp.]
MDNRGNIVIFQTKDGKTSIDVKLENETVWLTLNQIAELFSRDKSVISRHISNVFNEGELERNSVVAKNATTASDGKIYQVEYFNLDVIISVGYRVKSQRGTQFRIWANKILKDYLIKGYAINQQAKAEQLEDLKSTVRLLSNVIEHKQLTLDEANGLLRVITDYTYGLDTLDKYDYQQLEVTSTTVTKEFRATYDEAMNAIRLLQKKFGSSDLFGNEKDQSFKSSINTIYQTFGGEELYPSIEEKAAMLFYLVVKNHSFSDGNKRIAAFLFLWFLERNEILYKPDGSKLIGNNTLVALTLMIAESRTEEKDVMVKVVINLINRNN